MGPDMKTGFLMTVAVMVLVLVGMFLVTCTGNELCKSNSSAGFNGSFEITDSGYPVNWAFFPDPESGNKFQVSVDETRVKDGSRSLKLVSKQNDITTGFRSRRVPVQAGKNYRISFWVQNVECNFKVKRIVQDRTGKTNLRSTIIADGLTATDSWRKCEETLAVSGNESNVVLIFMVTGSGTFWCDKVEVMEITE